MVNLEGSAHGLYLNTISTFALKDKGKQNTSTSIARFPAYIQTQGVPEYEEELTTAL
jgi:hypothetical protein